MRFNRLINLRAKINNNKIRKKVNVDKIKKDINFKYRNLLFEVVEHEIFEKFFINLIDLMLCSILKKYVYELLLKRKKCYEIINEIKFMIVN